jgi:hypothetical protein
MRTLDRSSAAGRSPRGHQGALRRDIPQRLRHWRAAGALASLGAAALIIGPSAAASASGGSHTQSFTQTFHGSQPFSDVNPCTGGALDGTQSSNIIFHETFFPAGDELWATFTEEDSFSVTDGSTGVTYAGHATDWDNLNMNEQNANQTFTFSAHATGSDGSTISAHEVAHITLLPGGTISVLFDKPSLTCG